MWTNKQLIDFVNEGLLDKLLNFLEPQFSNMY